MDTYRSEFKRYIDFNLDKMVETKFKKTAFVSGIIMDVANFGNRVAISLDDGTSRVEISCYAERFNRLKDKLKIEHIVVMEVSIRERDGVFYLSLNNVLTVVDARKRWLKKISVKIAGDDMPLFYQLQNLLRKMDKIDNQVVQVVDNPDEATNHQNTGVPLSLCVYTNEAIGNINMPEHWQIEPDDETLEKLKHYVPVDNIHYHFA